MKILDKNNKIKNALLELGFILPEDVTQPIDSISCEEALIIGFSSELEKLKAEYLESAMGIIIFGEIKPIPGNIVGHFAENISDQDEKNTLKNLINTLCSLRDTKNKERFIISTLYERLLEIERNSTEHSQNLRKINKALVPKRFTNLKGLEIAARYQPGSRVGSEYYDAYFKGSKGIILLITSSSYLLSTVAISLFGDLKSTQKSTSSFYQEYLNELEEEIKNLGRDQDFSFCLLRVNSRDLSLKGISIGRQLFGTSGNIWIEESSSYANVEVQLKAGEKFLIGSRGLSRQIETNDNFALIDGILNNKKNSVQDIADEIFLSLDNKDKKFLEWDASVLVLEATKNAIYSI